MTDTPLPGAAVPRSALHLPDDIHEHVLALTLALVDASACDDTRECWRLHAELAAFCDATAAAGRDHPFLWETLGDFTSDALAAIALYQRALALIADTPMRDYRASLHLALAGRHADLGDQDAAWLHARQADEHARHLPDLDLRRQVSEFMLELTTTGHGS